MMKKGIYAIFAALAVFALVMTGCPGTNTPGPGPGPGPNPQADDAVRFVYEDGTYQDITFEAGETTWLTVYNALTKKTDTKAGEWVFGYWEDQVGDKWGDNGTATIDAMLTLKAHFWSTTLSGTDALEKVWLNNTQFAVYEFTVPSGKSYADITHISANFKASEAQLNAGNTRPIRPMGPYFYNDTPVVGADGWYFYGDFAVDTFGAYAAKFNSSDTKGYTDFNKFHPYLLSNTGGWNAPDWDGLNGYDATKATPAGDKVSPNTWFNVKLATSGYGWNSGTNSPSRVKGFIDADTNEDVILADTDFTKVYFGFGIPNAAKPEDQNKGHNATVAAHGVTTLIKDVTIYWADGTTATGRIPSFPKREFKGATTEPEEVTGETTNQVFATYITDNVQYNWRGGVTATVVIPKDPTYVPPVEVPHETETRTITDATTINLQNAGTVTVEGLKATVDIATKGEFGGFQIDLPDNWAGYDTITINYTATVNSSVSKVTVKQGFQWTTDYSDGVQYSQYKDITAGTQSMVLKVAGFNNGTIMATPGISFQINVNGDADVPQDWDLTITSIVLTP